MAYLTPAQHHFIREIILAMGFNPVVDFQQEETQSQYTIVHRETKQYFTLRGIENENNTYTYKYSRYPAAAREYSKDIGTPLDVVGTHLRTWLADHVKTQIRNDNLGDEWRRIIVPITLTPKFFGDEGQFQPLDSLHLEKSLDQFPDFIRTLKIQPELTKFWIDEVDELKKEIRTVKKKVFLYKLLGLAMSIGQFIDDKEKRTDLVEWFEREAEFVRERLM